MPTMLKTSSIWLAVKSRSHKTGSCSVGYVTTAFRSKCLRKQCLDLFSCSESSVGFEDTAVFTISTQLYYLSVYLFNGQAECFETTLGAQQTHNLTVTASSTSRTGDVIRAISVLLFRRNEYIINKLINTECFCCLFSFQLF